MKARIDEINANTRNNYTVWRQKATYSKICCTEAYTIFDGQQDIMARDMAVDITLKDAFYIDGETDCRNVFSEPCINVPIDGIYIVVRYDFIKNTCSISSNSTSVPSAISGDVWTFTLYHIHDINLEMKIDSESPTGKDMSLYRRRLIMS